MKKIVLFSVFMLAMTSGLKAQAEFSAGADVVSSYVWRGQYLGGSAIQPSLGLSAGGLSVGAWGSVDLVNPVSAKEFDLSLSYSIAGLSIGITDYWIQGQVSLGDNAGYFNYDKDNGSAHTFELNLGYTLPIEKLPLSLSWNTNIAGADGVKGDDAKTAYSSYFEIGCPFSVKDISLDAAIGLTPWETSFYGANGLSVINISLKASKEIKIGDFTLPVFSQLVINPRYEDAFLVFGISL